MRPYSPPRILFASIASRGVRLRCSLSQRFRRRIGRIRGFIVRFRRMEPLASDRLSRWGEDAARSGIGKHGGEAGCGAPRRAVLLEPRSGPLDHPTARIAALPSPGDRDETRNGCATRHERGVRSAGAAVVARRSRRRSAGRGRRTGISRRGLRRFSHQDRRRQCRSSAPATHHRSACAADIGTGRGGVWRRYLLLRRAGARNSVSGSWHDDDDVVACPAALSASVAFGHVR